MRPRVVVDADVLGRERTGDETHVSSLLAHLPSLDEGISFAAVTRRPQLVPAGVEAVELPARSQPVRMALTLPRTLRRLRPDLTHFQHVVAPGTRSATVVTVHDLSFERNPRLMSRRDRFFFRTMVPRSARRADRVLAVSQQTKRDLVELYGIRDEKIVVTPNGIDEVFGTDGPRQDGRPYLLFVGALQPRKDPLAAIEALALTRSDLRLVVAGPDRGSGDDAREAAVRHGVAERVEFVGHVAKEELARLYRGAEALVFPSRYEGFGLPVVEAMASGTPVVAAAAGAVPEVAGGAAILVDPGDTTALADGIERAIANRERLVRAGLEQAERFNWAETARRTIAVYRELL
jgi:glycosyltransferase involved in cell wall biosynthesis